MIYNNSPLNSFDFTNCISYNYDYAKQHEKKLISKKSSGLGFYIFAYFMTLNVSSTVIAFVLMLANGIYEEIASTSHPLYHMLYTFTAVFSAFIPALLYLAFSRNNINDVILTKPTKSSIVIPLIMIGMAIAMLANTATEIISNNLSFFGIENTAVIEENAVTPLAFALNILSTAVVPAFAEEFAYRGIFLGVLRKYGDAFAIVTSAIVFGAMHGNLGQIPFAFILGLLFGFLTCKTNSIIPAIIVHFINNFYAVIMNTLSNNNFLSSRKLYSLNYLIIAIFLLAGIIAFIYLIKKDKNFFNITDKSTYSGLLTFKEKIKAFLLNPGIILSLSIFFIEMILYTNIFSFLI